jgi:hypothetical protein
VVVATDMSRPVRDRNVDRLRTMVQEARADSEKQQLGIGNN